MAATRAPSSAFLSLWITASKGKSRALVVDNARSFAAAPSSSRAMSSSSAASSSAVASSTPSSSSSPTPISSTSQALSLLRGQANYIVASLVGRTFTLHPRDVVTIPRLRDVEVGDVLELDRIHEVGSRDYTLRAQDLRGERERVVAARNGGAVSQGVAEKLAQATQREGHSPVPSLRLSSSWTTQHLLPSGLAHTGAVLSPETVRARAVVVEHTKGALERIVKFKRRKGYKKTIQHKQGYTRIRLEAVKLGGEA